MLDGTDLTQLKGFLKAFQITIEARCDTEMLYYLEKSTDGTPGNLFKYVSYQTLIWDINRQWSFKEKYGNEFKID